MTEITNLQLIRYSLSDLNNKQDGDELFQNMAYRCVQLKHPNWIVFPSSGSAAGGDGGRDGYFEIPERNTTGKIAASTEIEYKSKIQDELKKCKGFSCMVYCSNQPIKNTERDKIINGSSIELEILDLTDISILVERDAELQELLSVPVIKNELKIEQLRNHCQLKNDIPTIENYIPRRTHFIDSCFEDKGIEDFLNNRMKPRICLIDSSAGFGKTAYLKYLYYCILYRNMSDIPPFFIPLEGNYRFGKIQQVIDDITDPFSSDNTVQDYILLIDGIDEIGKKQLLELTDEIMQLLNSNQSSTRLCLLAGRTGEYSVSGLHDKFGNNICQLAIEGLSKDDLRVLIEKKGFPSDHQAELADILLATDVNADNVFYVTRALEYYHETESTEISLVSLLKYVSEKELKNLFRDEDYDYVSIAKLAYQMIKQREFECSGKKELGFINYRGTKLQFSHKSIQEYLAASYLSSKECGQILDLVSSLGLIIPHLKNTTGLLLNILAYEGNSDFSTIIEALRKEPENYYTLFKIDPSFLGKDVRLDLIKSYLIKYEGYDWKRWDNQDFIKLFNYDFDENIAFVFSKIESEKGETREGYIQQCHEVLVNVDSISSEIKQYIKNLLFGEIEFRGREGKVNRSLFYSMAKLHVDYLSEEEISILIAYLKENIESDTLTPITAIISENLTNFTANQFETLFCTYVEICKHNAPSLAHFVPSQISALTNFPDSKLHISTFFFPQFLKKLIEFDSSFFIQILKNLDAIVDGLRGKGYLDELNLDSGLFSVLSDCANVKIDEDTGALILRLSFSYRNAVVFDSLISKLEAEQVFCFIKDRLVEENNYYTVIELIRVFDNFIRSRVLQDVSCFRFFHQIISKISGQVERDFLSGFLLDENVSDQVKQLFDHSLLAILESNNLKKRMIDGRQEIIRTSFHAGFNKESFLDNDLIQPFKKYTDEIIPKDDIYSLEWEKENGTYSLYSPFVVSVIEEIHRKTGACDYSSIRRFLEKDYDFTISVLILHYIENYKLEFNLLTECELSFLCNVIKKILEINPYPVFKGEYPRQLGLILNLYRKGLVRDCIVREINETESFGVLALFVFDLASLNYSYENEFAQLMSDFPIDLLCEKVLDAIPILKNDNYFLERICSFLRKASGFSATIVRRIREELIPMLKKTVKDNLNNPSFFHHSITAFLNESGISLPSFCSVDELSRGLVYDNEHFRFEPTIIYDWVDIYNKKTEREKKIVLEVLHDYFRNASVLESKRQCVELILCYDNRDYWAFVWLARYILKNDNCCLTEHIFGSGFSAKTSFTACKLSWRMLNKLFDRAKSFGKELCNVIQKTVLYSYSRIALDSCKSDREIRALLRHLSKLVKGNPDWQFQIETKILDIKEKFIDLKY